MSFAFEPDIRRAHTPPAHLYTDPAVFELERQRVFARSWQLAARASQLSETGAYVAARVAGQPIVAVRDGDELRAFHNVCRHRAGPVASGCGIRKSIQCAYHGWTYGLDGRLMRAPEMGGVEGFRCEDVALESVAVGRWGPLVMCGLEPAVELEALVGGISLDSDLAFVLRREYELDCNWKIYVDNYLEGYHIPFVHPELMRELDYDQYSTTTDRYWSRQYAPLRPVARPADARRYVPRLDDDDAAYYWIFPNMMLNIYQGQLQTNIVEPLGVERTRVVFEWYAAVPPDDAEVDPKWSSLVEFSDLVQDQDTHICEAVQRNMRSPACRPGRYSARRENGVHHFHGLLHEFLSD
jgi:choline monooxygenase